MNQHQDQQTRLSLVILEAGGFEDVELVYVAMLHLDIHSSTEQLLISLLSTIVLSSIQVYLY